MLWANAALEPSFYTGLGMQMLDPGMWATMANSMMHPNTYSAWMPLMTDPNVYMKWLAASMDPNFLYALLSQFSDPGKLMRWLMAPVDPKVFNLALQSINPAVYLKWMVSARTTLAAGHDYPDQSQRLSGLGRGDVESEFVRGFVERFPDATRSAPSADCLCADAMEQRLRYDLQPVRSECLEYAMAGAEPDCNGRAAGKVVPG